MRLFVAALCLVLAPALATAVPAPAAPPAAGGAVVTNAAPAKDAGTTVQEAEVRRVITDYVTQKTASLPAQTTIKRIGYNGGALRLPAGAVTYEVIAPDSWEGWGNVPLALIVRVDGQVRKNLSIPVEVEALSDMVVATRTLERGETVSAADVVVAKRDMGKVGGRFCRDPQEVIGKRVKSAMHANTPLRTDYLELVPVVKSGQIVTVLVENDAIRVTASGRAKISGGIGELITVQNLTSMKEFPARVIDSSTVKVDF